MSYLSTITEHLKRINNSYTTKTKTIALLVLILITGGTFKVLSPAPQTDEAPLVKQKQVRTQVVGTFGDTSTFGAIGIVTATSEARLETESAGRVTDVRVGIGDIVYAGQVIASLENASERALLLQAEGAYESALVGSSQAGISLEEARTNASNSYRSAFTVADDTVRNITDELFTDIDASIIGLRISGGNKTSALTNTRREIGSILSTWSQALTQTNTETLLTDLNTAESHLVYIGTFVSDLSEAVAEENPNDVFTLDVLASYKSRLSTARTRIDSMLQSISIARNTLLQAEKMASGSAVSSEADARIKQALGALKSAQASYEKTLVRSPINGVVNAFYISENEYAGQSTPVAIIANNDALEIKTSVSEKDRNSITIGSTVSVVGGAIGTVTRIAPAIDPTTGKIEVRIGIKDREDLRNGDTVSVNFSRSTRTGTSEAIAVPISAFKITAEGPVAFTVENNVLVAHEVVLGAITGENVMVREGLTPDMRIVIDARGLKAGERVDVTQE